MFSFYDKKNKGDGKNHETRPNTKGAKRLLLLRYSAKRYNESKTNLLDPR